MTLSIFLFSTINTNFINTSIIIIIVVCELETKESGIKSGVEGIILFGEIVIWIGLKWKIFSNKNARCVSNEIIEIGVVESKNRKLSGCTLHVFSVWMYDRYAFNLIGVIQSDGKISFLAIKCKATTRREIVWERIWWIIENFKSMQSKGKKVYN